MAELFASGRLHALNLARNRLTALPSWAGPLATNITVINVEGNRLRRLPDAVPPTLHVLRLGGNPISGVGIEGAQRHQLLELLDDAPLIQTLSVGMAEGGPQTPWDGFQHDYVVTAMPGLLDNGGRPKCPSTGVCPFEIKTDVSVKPGLPSTLHEQYSATLSLH
jgi:hypothetical protein